MHRSELIWQLRASNSAKFTTVPEDIRQKLELAYQSDPKAIVKDEPSQLHVSVVHCRMAIFVQNACKSLCAGIHAYMCVCVGGGELKATLQAEFKSGPMHTCFVQY